LQPRNKRDFEYTAITIGRVLFSTREKLNYFLTLDRKMMLVAVVNTW
jgi:hypothetical protein